MRLELIISFVLFWALTSCNNEDYSTGQDNGKANWIKVESGVTKTLYDIDFFESKNGWIVGDSGIILHTKDGGNKWETQSCNTGTFLKAVDFVDNYCGWACGKDTILCTTDGGETWNLQYFQNLGDGHFRDIQFLNKDTGFAVGGYGDFDSKGILLRTDNGGENWSMLSGNELSTLTKISIENENIWICGFGGKILLSKDAGLSWDEKNFNLTPLPSFTCIQFVDSLHGWVSSRDDYLGFYATQDGGKIWVRISESSFMDIGGVLSFFFINKDLGWLCNFPFDRTLITKDSGSSWETGSDIYQRIYSFTFLQNGDGWAVGSKGGILHYINNN